MGFHIGEYMLKAMSKFILNIFLLISIIFLAFVVRVISIGHGYPFIFHPDEPAVMSRSMGLRFDANPGHFDWPHLHFYINYYAYSAFIKFRGLIQTLGFQDELAGAFPVLWRDPLIFYYISRFIAVLMGTFTLIPIYLSLKTFFSKNIGLIGTLIFAFLPHHVHTSAYALIDVPMTFWLSWAVYFSVQIIKSNSWKAYILSGLFIGLAASTKYNAGLFSLIVPFALLIRILEKNSKVLEIQNLKNLIYSGIFAFLGFVIGTPYFIWNFDTFIRTDGPAGALWQFSNVGKVEFSQQLFQFYDAFSNILLNDLSVSVIILFVFSVLIAIYALFKNKNYRVLYFVIPALAVIFYISGFEKNRSHYFIPSYLFIVLSIASSLYYVYSTKLKKEIISTVLAFLLIVPIYYSIENALILKQKDTRVLLYEYLLSNIDTKDVIIYDSNVFKPVIDKFSSNRTKKTLDKDELENFDLLLINIPSEELKDFENNIHDKSFVKSDYILKKEISNSFRRGPNIYVYSK